MDVHETFRMYFSNDAPYSFDGPLEKLGYEFSGHGKWTKGEPDMLIDGLPVIAYRHNKSRGEVPPFARALNLADAIINDRTTYLIKKSDDAIVMKDISKPSGFPYAT